MKNEISIQARRFKRVREELNFTQQAFAAVLNYGTSTADIERGKTKIPGVVVMELMNQFNINPLWLYGKSFTRYTTFASGDVSPKLITVTPDNSDVIVLVNQKAAAGYPNNIHDTSWYETLPAFNIPLPEFRNASYRGFQVEGDSMVPNIRPNEWVLGKAVETITDVNDGKIYIVVMQDSVLVKKIQKIPNSHSHIQLVSINKEYLPIRVSVKNIQELWQVNSKLTFGVNESSNTSLLQELQVSMNELKAQVKRLKES